MGAVEIADLTPRELEVYAAAYLTALDDASDRCRRNSEAIADLEHQLAEARKDAAYWEHVANPPRVPTGPAYAELEKQRTQLAHAAATTTKTPWADVPTRTPDTGRPIASTQEENMSGGDCCDAPPSRKHEGAGMPDRTAVDDEVLPESWVVEVDTHGETGYLVSTVSSTWRVSYGAVLDVRNADRYNSRPRAERAAARVAGRFDRAVARPIER